MFHYIRNLVCSKQNWFCSLSADIYSLLTVYDYGLVRQSVIVYSSLLISIIAFHQQIYVMIAFRFLVDEGDVPFLHDMYSVSSPVDSSLPASEVGFLMSPKPGEERIFPWRMCIISISSRLCSSLQSDVDEPGPLEVPSLLSVGWSWLMVASFNSHRSVRSREIWMLSRVSRPRVRMSLMEKEGRPSAMMTFTQNQILSQRKFY